MEATTKQKIRVCKSMLKGIKKNKKGQIFSYYLCNEIKPLLKIPYNGKIFPIFPEFTKALIRASKNSYFEKYDESVDKPVLRIFDYDSRIKFLEKLLKQLEKKKI